MKKRSPLLAAALLSFAACAAAPSRTPAGVDLRPELEALGLPPRAQGPRPTCSVFTTVAAIEVAAARASGHGERLSVEYLNWAANAANARHDDGDFFHHALSGYERFGICAEALWPYATAFDPASVPPPEALVAAGRHAALAGQKLRVRWLRENDGKRGLDDTQLAAVVASLDAGWPVAVGSGHSRLLVGYRGDGTSRTATFLTLDSGLGGYGEVPADWVRGDVCDAFVVDVAR